MFERPTLTLVLTAVMLLVLACGETEVVPESTPFGTPVPPSPPPLGEFPYGIVPEEDIVLEEVLSDPGGTRTTVSRGDSKVVFNGDTGEVIEWAVQPEDEEEFSLLDTRDR
jgi:hypothetical protein